MTSAFYSHRPRLERMSRSSPARTSQWMKHREHTNEMTSSGNKCGASGSWRSPLGITAELPADRQSIGLMLAAASLADLYSVTGRYDDVVEHRLAILGDGFPSRSRLRFAFELPTSPSRAAARNTRPSRSLVGMERFELALDNSRPPAPKSGKKGYRGVSVCADLCRDVVI